jgi:hypothetical protein
MNPKRALCTELRTRLAMNDTLLATWVALPLCCSCGAPNQPLDKHSTFGAI